MGDPGVLSQIMADQEHQATAALAELVEQSHEALIALSLVGRVVVWNRGATAIFGYPAYEAIGRSLAELIGPDERGRETLGAPALRNLVETEALGSHRLQIVTRRCDGSLLEVDVSLRHVGRSGAEPYFVLSARAAAQAGRVREDQATAARFSGLLEATPDAMVIVSQDGRIQLVNGQLEKLFGYARSELVGHSVDLLVPARYRREQSAHRMEYFRDSHARPMGAGLEFHGVRRDGTEFPAEISLASVETSAGKLVTAAIRDVTDRKRTEELKSRLAAVVDSSDDAIIGKTLAGLITSWNKGAERIFGYSEADAIGRSIAMLIPAGRKGEQPAILRRLLGGERIAPFETVLRRNDGQVVQTSVAISAVRDARGKVIGVSTMVRDISDRKRGEQALARATESAETASREFEAFRYSVAHDLRAPLRGIDGFSHALLDEYPDKLDSEGRRYLAKVRESAQSMAQLIESLLALARISQSELKRERVDLSAIAHTATRRLQTEHPGRRVDVRITDGLNCQGDDRLLGIAFANLFANAWKFTAKRPDPRVEFGVTRIRERDAFFVSDNGAGFDMAFAEKLFGVFQRLHTGSEFAGTGIGLATVQRVIRRHGGRIWAEAAVEHGATFYFTLAERGLNP